MRDFARLQQIEKRLDRMVASGQAWQQNVHVLSHGGAAQFSRWVKGLMLLRASQALGRLHGCETTRLASAGHCAQEESARGGAGGEMCREGDVENRRKNMEE